MAETKNRNCNECGEPIGEKRLLARPKTTLCIECQEAKEANGDFTRHKIETSQQIAGWQFEGQVDILIKGDD
jgi:RNA polymerase-binding transcription factor DksA